jgi:hypothetical protein
VQSTIGRTFAATSNTARQLPKLGDLPAGDGLGAFPSDGGGMTPPGAGNDGSDGSTTGAVGPAPAGDSDAGRFAPLPSGDGTAAPAGAAPGTAQPAAEPSLQALPARGLVPDRTDAGRFYPVLVLGGALLALAVSLFRKIGVKPTWS